MKPAKYLTVIGGSAGSLSVLLSTLPQLHTPEDRAVIIVLHRPATDDTQLAPLLNLKTCWSVKEAEDKDQLAPGNIYLAPGGYHLLIEKDKSLSLDCSEKINFSRPAIDASFETAAEAFGPYLGCLLLSGANADGVAGLGKAKAAAATIAVQNPEDAQSPFMPASAVKSIPDLRILSSFEIAAFIEGHY